MRKALVTFVFALTLAMALGSALSAYAQTAPQPPTGGNQTSAPATPSPAPTPNPSQQPPSAAPASQQTAPSASPSQTAAGDSQQTAPPAEKKMIKDQNEYNAYIAALNTQDPAQRGAAMDAFAQQYPQSVVLSDALDQAMAAYQQAGDQARLEASAKRILAMNPGNVRALAIVTALDRGMAQTGNTASLQEACTDAQKGVQSLSSFKKTEGMTDADFQKVVNQVSEIFNGTAGFCALQSKDYASARKFYQAALQGDPNNMSDVYQLAIADLESNPPDVNGFWYGAKALDLAQAQKNTQAAQSMQQYFSAKYKKFHGGTDGWDQIVASAAAQPTPPAGFTVKAAPTPQELACKAVQENDPSQLSVSDWEFILQYRDASACNKAAADKVWAVIQEKEKNGEAKLKLAIKVISADRTTIEAALADDNQKANKADLRIELEKPLARPPAPGTTTEVVGVLASYQPNPFMLIMKNAELPAAKPPAKARARSARR
jgi:tetratricopeptide (TPR) repeat protein